MPNQRLISHVHYLVPSHVFSQSISITNPYGFYLALLILPMSTSVPSIAFRIAARASAKNPYQDGARAAPLFLRPNKVS